MTKIEYAEYLKSGHWRDLWNAKLAATPRKCEVCASLERIDLHHVVYREIFDVAVEDLRWVCHHCHERIHEFVDADKLVLDGDPSALWERTLLLLGVGVVKEKPPVICAVPTPPWLKPPKKQISWHPGEVRRMFDKWLAAAPVKNRGKLRVKWAKKRLRKELANLGLLQPEIDKAIHSLKTSVSVSVVHQQIAKTVAPLVKPETSLKWWMAKWAAENAAIRARKLEARNPGRNQKHGRHRRKRGFNPAPSKQFVSRLRPTSPF